MEKEQTKNNQIKIRIKKQCTAEKQAKMVYRKARFMLKKIEKRKKNGKRYSKVRRVKLQALIDEHLENKKLAKEASLSRAKELSESKTVKDFEVLKTESAEQVRKKNSKVPETTRTSKNIIKDDLSMALVNDIDGQIKPVYKADWPMLEIKINDILMNYLLNTNCAIPHYEVGEIYRGFLLMQCKDKFSKDMMCHCVAKIRYMFKGMSVTLIPAAQIPQILGNPSFYDFSDQELELPLLTSSLASNTEESSKSFLKANQGFQRSVNYFNSDCEIYRENLDSREQMSSSFTSSNYMRNEQEEEEYNGTSTELFQNSLKLNLPREEKLNYFQSECEVSRGILDSREQMSSSLTSSKSVARNEQNVEYNGTTAVFPQNSLALKRLREEKLKSNYRRKKRYLRHMAKLKEITPIQAEHLRNSMRFIKKYESVNGFGTEATDFQQVETLLTNKFANCSWNYNQTGEQSEMSIANKTGENFMSNCPSPQLSCFKPKMEHMALELPSHFKANFETSHKPGENFGSNSQRPECPSTVTSSYNECKIEEMDENLSQNLVNYCSPKEESLYKRRENSTGKIAGFSSAFTNSFQPELHTFSQQNERSEESFNETRQKLSTSMELSPEFAATSKIDVNKFAKQDSRDKNSHLVKSNMGPNFDRSEYSYNWGYSLSTELETSLSGGQGRLEMTQNLNENGAIFNPANNFNSTKAILEKRIYECLNAFEEDTTPTTTKITSLSSEIKTDPEKTLVSYPPIAQLKQNSHALRKSTTDNPRITQIITISDDSAESDVVEVKTDMEKTSEEYFNALDYLQKKQFCDLDSLSGAEKLQIEIYHHKLRKYEKLFANNNQESKTAPTVKSTRQSRCGSKTNNLQQTSQVSKSQDQIAAQKQGYWKSGGDKTFPLESFQTRLTDMSNRAQSTGWLPTNVTPDTSTHSEVLSNSETNSDLQIAIIDRNHKDGKISREAWLKIEKDLLEQLAREMQQTNNTNIGMFECAYWRYDIKIIQCEHIESLDFIKRFIHNQHIYWPNAEYDVIPVRELPKRCIVKVWIPPPIIEDMAMLRILKGQNSKFYSLDWTLINSRERENSYGKDLFISISATSLKRLRTRNGEIRFGTNRLKMILPQEDQQLV